jgi:type VI secretion system protein VasI
MDPKKIFGGLAIVLLLLWGLGRIVSHSTRAAGAGDDAASVSQTIPQDKWTVKQKASPMDSSKTVVLTLNAENTIHGPIGDRTPSLIIRCKEGKTDAYVVTGMAASVEEDSEGGPSEDHQVRLRFDDNPPATDRWSESTSHSGLFASDAVAFSKQLAGAQKFTFEFTPFDANPAVAQFDLKGLSSHLPKVAEVCGWSVN